MTTLPPHPGLAGLAAREDASSVKIVREAPEKREPDFLEVWGRLTTTPADITRAADDDSDHIRSVFN